ncbi:unnamed protein product [Rotaria sp. Silwood2]|nr:unnamed protein product [Rotaria sp. Silwood2]CAF4321429.1 unnamed protein product [Rotaria sp. Silwood2]
MSGWFSIDPNKLKELATSTLINAQKQIDKVLDIKDGASNTEQQPIVTNSGINNPPLPTTTAANNDDFFSTFLGNQKPSTPNIEKQEVKIEKDVSLTNWNAWSDQNNASQLISSESQSDLIANEQNTNEEERIPITESIDIQSSSSITESVGIEQVPSSSSLTESSTITESSSSESANSLKPILSIPSSESTIIGQINENTIDEEQIFIDNENIESDIDHRSETIQPLPSDKLDVIDSWINNRENNNTTEYVLHFYL